MTFTRNILTLSLLLTISASTIAVDSNAIDKDSSTGKYTLDMRGVDIREFINTISKMIGKTIITDTKVRGKVDIQSPTGLTADELYEVFLVQLSINGFSVVDTQNGILKVIPSQGAKLEGTRLLEGSAIQSSEALVTRIVKVKNVNANQLAATLRPLIDPRLGIISAYDTSNVILVTDRSSNVRRIAQIIAKVDQADSQTLELMPLYNATASELERILSNLVLQNNGKQASGSGSIITSDQRTNTLIVKADETTRNKIRRIVAQLDSQVQTTSNTKVIYLKYAKADEIAKVLQGISDTIIKEEGQKQGSSNSFGSNINIDTHEPTNTIVMSGSPHIIKSLESIISQLDIRRAQVLVEAIIAEVSEEKAKELGFQWLVASDGVGVGGSAFSTDNSPNIISAATSIASDSTPGFGNGLNLGFGSINVGGFSFAALINAIETDEDSNLLSTPSIVTLDNEEAYIQVGQEIPIITSTTTSSDSNPYQTIERKDIGIKLTVTPQINEGDAIQLKIEQEVSTINSDITASDVVTDKRLISTTVLVNDGGVITLGGLIEEKIEDTHSQVPLLGDLPFIGKLFSSTTASRQKRTLVVFIRPTIIRSQSVANQLSRVKYNYLHAQQVLFNETNTALYSKEHDTIKDWQAEGAIPAIDLTAGYIPSQEVGQLPPPLKPEDIPIIEHSFSAPASQKKAR